MREHRIEWETRLTGQLTIEGVASDYVYFVVYKHISSLNYKNRSPRQDTHTREVDPGKTSSQIHVGYRKTNLQENRR